MLFRSGDIRDNLDVLGPSNLGGGVLQTFDPLLKIGVSTEHVSKFGDDRPIERPRRLGAGKKLEVWDRARREAARRRKSE